MQGARNQVLLLMEKERPYVQLVEESDEGEAVPIAQLISTTLGDCARNEANRLVRQGHPDPAGALGARTLARRGDAREKLDLSEGM